MFEKESGDKSPHSKTADPTIELRDLRIVFHWCGDRYGHRIEQLVDGAWQVVLESVEGLATEDWPVSPALQSLHIEQRTAGAVALLVGKAGASHWSASVEPLEPNLGFRFDIACRTGQPPQKLGSAYRLETTAGGPLVLVAVEDYSSAFSQSLESPRAVWHIAPIETPQEFPATICWRYTISRPDRPRFVLSC